MDFALLGFGLTWDPWPLPSSWFFPLGTGISVQCLFHYSILEAYNPCLVSQLEGNFTSRGIIPESYPYLIQTIFRWDFGLRVDANTGWSGGSGDRGMYLHANRTWTGGNQRAESYRLNCVPSQFICSSHNLQYLRMYLYFGDFVLVAVQLLSCVWLFVTPWTAACHAPLSFTISWSLLKFMSIESVMPSNHLILCHPLLLLPSIFPHQALFKWVSSSHQVAKILELQHQSFQWIFRIDFL